MNSLLTTGVDSTDEVQYVDSIYEKILKRFSKTQNKVSPSPTKVHGNANTSSPIKRQHRMTEEEEDTVLALSTRTDEAKEQSYPVRFTENPAYIKHKENFNMRPYQIEALNWLINLGY